MTDSPSPTLAVKPPPREDQLCINCKKPFRFGLKTDAEANVYTTDGKKECAISGVCERCFDFLFEDLEDDDESEFCLGCSDEPTLSELDAGRCDCCGKPLGDE